MSPRRTLFAAPLTGALMILAACVLPAKGTATTPPFRLPEPVVHTLPNGLTVAVFRDSRLGLVQVQLTVAAGSATEGAFPAGVSYVTSQLIGQATASRDLAAIQDDVERAGGHMAARIGRDIGSLSGTFLASQLPLALDVLGDASMHAVFSEGDFARVSRNARSLARGPAGIARQPEDRLWTAAFGEAGYGHAPAGTAESLDRLTITDVRNFYNSRWGPSSALLAIAGDVQPDSVIAWASEVFGGWTARAAGAATMPKPVDVARSMTLVHRPDATQCEVWLGVPGPKAGDPDEIPVALASQLVARAAGLAGVRVGQSALRSGGFVWLSATSRVDSAAFVAKRLEAAFASLRTTPPRATDLEPLKTAIQSSFPLRFESLEGLADQWSAEAALGMSFADLVAFPAQVGTVTAASVTAAARKWFDPAHMSFVVAGPADRLRAPLAAIAPIATSGGTDDPVTPELEKSGRARIARTIAAHGSLAALKKVRDSIIEASTVMRVGKTEATAKLVQMRKEPERMIYDLRIEERGSRDVLADGKSWSSPIDTLTKFQDSDTTKVSALRQGFRGDVIHVLLDAADPKARVAARGTTFLNGANHERVEVWTAFGSHRMMYLDPVTHLLSGVELQDSDNRDGSAAVRRWYHDYRAVDGIRLPFDEQRWLGAQRVMHLKLTRYALNAGVADGLFVHPETPLPPSSR